MKNVRCCKCGRILAVADDATETVCTQCGAKLKFAPGNAAGHSYFDGKLRQYVGLNIVCLLQMIFTLFIGTPWVIIKKKKWLLKHTIVYGQRLKLTRAEASSSATSSSGSCSLS